MKNVIKSMVIMLSILAFTAGAFAQEPSKEQSKEQCKEQCKQAKKEQIKAKKIGFITTSLQLTTKEAELFWPIYNQYEKERQDLMSTLCKYKTGKPDLTIITEKEAEELIEKQLKQEQQMLELRKKYAVEFKKAISAKKIVQLYQAEHNFKKELLKEIRHNKHKERRPLIEIGK